MTDSFRVSPTELHAAAGRLRAHRSELQGDAAAAGSVARSLGSAWAGAAQCRYDELYARWDRAAREMLDALDEIATLMDHAAAVYESVEAEVSGAFS